MPFLRDPDYKTEVYELPNSTPPGKVVIRKDRELVVIWPGDLPEVIDALMDLEWKQVLGKSRN